ncbi:HGGxSTG domain-containing protein [Acidovorax sp.]|uniref:HGGxSTG domain-containing protein n=1 Tax=Acidovorax sp. TaxID=1872122 RepID=UPI0025BED8BB|nr:HGGxSTG domain-containing protein [Acidovorax sp.]
MASCGAKTRSGAPCKTPAMDNGRCRMHGGKAGETHSGNQHATKHGIYGRVLTDEEKDLWDSVELGRVDDELKLCRLRLMRAIRAEQEAKDLPELDGRTEEPAVVGGVPLDDETIEKRSYKRRDYAGAIDRLMGRIESLERTRAELMKANPPEDEPVAKIQIEVVNGKNPANPDDGAAGKVLPA